MSELARLIALAAEQKHIVFIGGAGVSTESGIPDFRSASGIYANTKTVVPAETILSGSYFHAYPEQFYAFYRKHLLYPNAKPNDAHQALARMESAGRLHAVITQNVDGLHSMAGSRAVLELHGSVHRNHCLNCRRFFSLNDILSMDALPRCPACGGIIKPDVTLFEEALPPGVYAAAEQAVAAADMLIIGGTSLAVYPAAYLVHAFRGHAIVVINYTPTPADRLATMVIRDLIGTILRELADGLSC